MENEKPFTLHTFYETGVMHGAGLPRRGVVDPDKVLLFFVATEYKDRCIDDDIYSEIIRAMMANGCKYPTEGFIHTGGAPEVFLIVNVTDVDWIQKNASPKFLGLEPGEVYLVYQFNHEKLDRKAVETQNGKVISALRGHLSPSDYGDGRWLAKVLQDMVVDILPTFTRLPGPLKLVSSK